MNKPPIIILEASNQPYLSIGIYSGGVTWNGTKYIYYQEFDAYIRQDYSNKFKNDIKIHRTWKKYLEHIKTIIE